MTSGRSRGALTTLFVAALVLRLGVGLWQGLARPAEPGTDEAEYVAYARSLVQDGEYRGMSPDVADQHHLTAYRTPGTSLFYAGLMALFGDRPAVLRVANAVIGAASVLLVLAIGLEVFPPAVAWLGAGGWALYPRSLLFSSSLLSEPLGLFVFLGFLLAALRFGRSLQPREGAIAGLLLGMAILVHPARLFMIPFVVLWALIQAWPRPRALAAGILIPLVAGLVVLPWSIRNYLVFHEVVPLSTGGGSAMLQGNNRVVATDPVLRGYSIWDTEIPEYAPALRSAGNELERDRRAGQFAREWLREHPGQWLPLALAKLRRAFTPFLQPQTPALFRWTELLSWGPVLLGMLLAVVPLLLQWLPNRSPGWLLHLALLHFVAITMLFFGNSRYRYPVEPLCVLFAAATAVQVWNHLRRSGSAQSPGAGAGGDGNSLSGAEVRESRGRSC